VRLLKDRMRKEELSLSEFLPVLAKRGIDRVPGTAVFMTGQPDSIPTALMHNLKHNKVLHQRNVIVCIDSVESPRVPEAARSDVRKVTDDFTVVHVRFGFMEEPDVPRALMRRRLGLNLNPLDTSYYLSRRALRPATHSEMPRWQSRLFIWLTRHASDASRYFRIPTDRAVEIVRYGPGGHEGTANITSCPWRSGPLIFSRSRARLVLLSLVPSARAPPASPRRPHVEPPEASRD
jgi:KUP system potassium uptake protein